MIPPGPRVEVSIKTISRVTDGMGGYTNTLSVAETLKGVLLPVRGNEKLLYDKETVLGDYLLFAKKGTVSPTEFDIIVYGTREFKILFVSTPFMSSKFYVLELEEVK